MKRVLGTRAVDNICPRDMAPHYQIEDSPGSRSGVYYSSACGSKIMDLGQQTVPILFGDNIKASAKFQVAEVSRALLRVGKVCELGNRMLFGAAGGGITNFASGKFILFQKEEGV